MRCHLPDAGVKRCETAHGRLRLRNRKNHATVQSPGNRMALLRNSALNAKTAKVMPNIWTQKMYTSSANCLTINHMGEIVYILGNRPRFRCDQSRRKRGYF